MVSLQGPNKVILSFSQTVVKTCDLRKTEAMSSPWPWLAVRQTDHRVAPPFRQGWACPCVHGSLLPPACGACCAPRRGPCHAPCHPKADQPRRTPLIHSFRQSSSRFRLPVPGHDHRRQGSGVQVVAGAAPRSTARACWT